MAKHREYRWRGLDRVTPPGEVTHRSVAPQPSEPMTEKQATYAARLCELMNLPFDPTWSKVRASREIRRMNRLSKRYRIGQ